MDSERDDELERVKKMREAAMRYPPANLPKPPPPPMPSMDDFAKCRVCSGPLGYWQFDEESNAWKSKASLHPGCSFQIELSNRIDDAIGRVRQLEEAHERHLAMHDKKPKLRFTMRALRKNAASLIRELAHRIAKDDRS